MCLLEPALHLASGTVPCGEARDNMVEASNMEVYAYDMQLGKELYMLLWLGHEDEHQVLTRRSTGTDLFFTEDSRWPVCSRNVELMAILSSNVYLST
jgi:hypothetical protein